MKFIRPDELIMLLEDELRPPVRQVMASAVLSALDNARTIELATIIEAKASAIIDRVERFIKNNLDLEE